MSICRDCNRIHNSSDKLTKLYTIWRADSLWLELLQLLSLNLSHSRKLRRYCLIVELESRRLDKPSLHVTSPPPFIISKLVARGMCRPMARHSMLLCFPALLALQRWAADARHLALHLLQNFTQFRGYLASFSLPPSYSVHIHYKIR